MNYEIFILDFLYLSFLYIHEFHIPILLIHLLKHLSKIINMFPALEENNSFIVEISSESLLI